MHSLLLTASWATDSTVGLNDVYVSKVQIIKPDFFLTVVQMKFPVYTVIGRKW